EVAGYGPVFGLDVLVHGDRSTGLALAQPHQAFVDGDADQPGGELGVALELIELLIRLQESVLGNILRVFTVLRDMLRNPEDLPVVLSNQLLERRDVPTASALNERNVGVNLVRYWGLDGGHKERLREKNRFR